MQFHLISLGCPKNLCDAEKIIAPLVEKGWQHTDDPHQAELIIINTCAFIASAIDESMATIKEMLKIKNARPKGKKPMIIVSGCLPQRRDLKKKLLSLKKLGVDQFLDLPSPENISKVICKLTPPWTAYLKIADGCDNRCSYCTIPDIRGKFVPRSKEAILKEARQLVEMGVKEIILIAQDSTRFPDLEVLLKRLCRIPKLHWLRIMYLHPARVTEKLIHTIASEPKIVKYLDLPIQHASDKILGLMRRGVKSAQIETLINKIRRKIPKVALRTTLIVGFPGEAEADFEQLVSFVKKIKFERLGVFKYSREKGTPAAKLNLAVSQRVRQNRFDKVMRLQRQISRSNNQKWIGKMIEILVERKLKAGYMGRSFMDAPEIDGSVRIITNKNLGLGSMVKARITGATPYDLIAKIT